MIYWVALLPHADGPSALSWTEQADQDELEVVINDQNNHYEALLRGLFALVVGLALCGVAAPLASGTDVLIMDGPDVVRIQSGAMASVLVALVGLAILLMSAAAVAIFVAWIGAIVNTADPPSKTWLVVELVLGLLGFAFVAVLAYVIGKPGRAELPRPVAAAPAVWTNDKTPSLSGTR